MSANKKLLIISLAMGIVPVAALAQTTPAPAPVPAPVPAPKLVKRDLTLQETREVLRGMTAVVLPDGDYDGKVRLAFKIFTECRDFFSFDVIPNVTGTKADGATAGFEVTDKGQGLACVRAHTGKCDDGDEHNACGGDNGDVVIDLSQSNASGEIGICQKDTDQPDGLTPYVCQSTKVKFTTHADKDRADQDAEDRRRAEARIILRKQFAACYSQGNLSMAQQIQRMLSESGAPQSETDDDAKNLRVLRLKQLNAATKVCRDNINTDPIRKQLKEAAKNKEDLQDILFDYKALFDCQLTLAGNIATRPFTDAYEMSGRLEQVNDHIAKARDVLDEMKSLGGIDAENQKAIDSYSLQANSVQYGLEAKLNPQKFMEDQNTILEAKKAELDACQILGDQDCLNKAQKDYMDTAVMFQRAQAAASSPQQRAMNNGAMPQFNQGPNQNFPNMMNQGPFPNPNFMNQGGWEGGWDQNMLSQGAWNPNCMNQGPFPNPSCMNPGGGWNQPGWNQNFMNRGWGNNFGPTGPNGFNSWGNPPFNPGFGPAGGNWNNGWGNSMGPQALPVPRIGMTDPAWQLRYSSFTPPPMAFTNSSGLPPYVLGGPGNGINTFNGAPPTGWNNNGWYNGR